MKQKNPAFPVWTVSLGSQIIGNRKHLFITFQLRSKNKVTDWKGLAIWQSPPSQWRWHGASMASKVTKGKVVKGHQMPPGERAAPRGLPWMWWETPDPAASLRGPSSVLGCPGVFRDGPKGWSFNSATVRPGQAGRGRVQPHSDTAGLHQRVHTTAVSHKSSRRWPPPRAGSWSLLRRKAVLGWGVRRGFQGAWPMCSFDLSGDYEGVTITSHTTHLLPVPGFIL